MASIILRHMLQAHEFIECPGCKRKLPNSAQNCHFCGVSTKNVARVAAPDKKHYAEFETPKWIMGLYYGLCAWWMIGGAISIGQVINDVATRKPTIFDSSPGYTVVDYALIGFGAISVIIGICMAFKVEAVRNFVNWIAFMKIVRGLGGLVGSILGIAIGGPIMIIFVIASLVDVIVAGMTVWLLSETGKVW